MKEIGIMEVGGFKVGHAQNLEAGTGLTVILLDHMSPAGLDVRGGGPASRESQILNPLMTAEGINAVVLSGGSAFGLDAAGGVQKYLEERGEGFAVGPIRVPLVCQSCVFDLGCGRYDVRPDAAMAYQACENASYDAPKEGNVGAGTGCTVGKIMGIERAMKTGFGTYAVQAGNIKVGAMVAVNAAGDVYGADGKVMAGLLSEDRKSLSSSFEAMIQGLEVQAGVRYHHRLRGHQCKAAQGKALQGGRYDPQRLCPGHPSGAYLRRRRQHLCAQHRRGGGQHGRGGHAGGLCHGAGHSPCGGNGRERLRLSGEKRYSLSVMEPAADRRIRNKITMERCMEFPCGALFASNLGGATKNAPWTQRRHMI